MVNKLKLTRFVPTTSSKKTKYKGLGISAQKCAMISYITIM